MVLGPAKKDRHGNLYWRCRCACGTIRYVSGKALRSGMSRSCGCESARLASARNRTHGATAGPSRAPEYSVWSGMIQRCINPKNNGFKNYGARGIRVCAEWSGSFAAFIRDMGLRPSGKHRLERSNNNGNYEPGNVIWATAAIQARNKRNNRNITIGEETLCVTDWANRSGVRKEVIAARLTRGWSPRDAVFTAPLDPKSARVRQLARKIIQCLSSNPPTIDTAKAIAKKLFRHPTRKKPSP